MTRPPIATTVRQNLPSRGDSAGQAGAVAWDAFLSLPRGNPLRYDIMSEICGLYIRLVGVVLCLLCRKVHLKVKSGILMRRDNGFRHALRSVIVFTLSSGERGKKMQ